MLSTDILISFAFMALLFLRHVAVLKKPNKINYAPLMLGIGGIATLIHFIVYSHATEITILLKESLFPFLVALLFFIVMNILNQTKEYDLAKEQKAFSLTLVQELSDLKSFMLDLETRMMEFSKENFTHLQELREEFQNDVKLLSEILKNQESFTKKFDEMKQWHTEVDEAFKHFTAVQMPELDNMVHKHIDVLRIAEQDHYNKLSLLLKNAVESRIDISQDIEDLREKLIAMQSLSEKIATEIVAKTHNRLTQLTEDTKGEMVSLKLHAEGIKTTLYEDENILAKIRQESELIMQEMVLSSKQMQELQKESSLLHTLVNQLLVLVEDVESVKSDYIKTQSQLYNIAQDMQKQAQKEQKFLIEKIEENVAKICQENKNSGEELSKNVEFLAKQAKLKKGYSQ
jgi:hypothetical protein